MAAEAEGVGNPDEALAVGGFERARLRDVVKVEAKDRSARRRVEKRTWPQLFVVTWRQRTAHREISQESGSATSAPQGGAVQGIWRGPHSGSRYIAYGVLRCGPNSPCSLLVSARCTSSRNFSRGMRRSSNGSRFVLARSSPRSGSMAALPQFTPPTLPGTAMV